jgi:glycosyltransferase involved in cell wall biosynthesis
MAVPSQITVNYYGEAFATSGYGTAVRSYIHALHRVGIGITLVGSGEPPSQFNDHLIRSIVGPAVDADFTIVHAIPSFWPRWAYSTRNVIAVTVWEADPIPRIWQRALSHAVDVWVPCTFNVDVFSKALKHVPFRLPYALPMKAAASAQDIAWIGVGASDFVFYSVFDWQYRKNAEGLMEAFLRAFPGNSDAVLLVKTISSALDHARNALSIIRRETGSEARVILLGETLTDEQIDQLHDRGDCYASLHRGEGWGYPLFAAAARGKPVIASAQGGPLDFLDPRFHHLIPCDEVFVQKPYFLFTPQMRWGEPNLLAAIDAFRCVYEHKERARQNAIISAQMIPVAYSLQRVGQMAEARLRELLEERKAVP